MTEQATHKECKKCALVKPVSEFRQRRLACKACQNEANRLRKASKQRKCKRCNCDVGRGASFCGPCKIENRRNVSKNIDKARAKDPEKKEARRIELLRNERRRIKELHDSYIKKLIKRNTVLEHCDIPKEFVELKRLNLLISRFIQEH